MPRPRRTQISLELSL